MFTGSSCSYFTAFLYEYLGINKQHNHVFNIHAPVHYILLSTDQDDYVTNQRLGGLLTTL